VLTVREKVSTTIMAMGVLPQINLCWKRINPKKPLNRLQANLKC
jgi:hypothetical protein